MATREGQADAAICVGFAAMTRGLEDFLGRYTVSRTIVDRKAGAEAQFEGLAEIAADGVGAVYRETGHLIMGDQRFEAERRYLWRARGPLIAVLFEDGRAFHEFDPVAGGQANEHLCGEDLYRGGYDVSQWSCWAVTWEVTGPRKDYTSVSWYVRR